MAVRIVDDESLKYAESIATFLDEGLAQYLCGAVEGTIRHDLAEIIFHPATGEALAWRYALAAKRVREGSIGND